VTDKTVVIADIIETFGPLIVTAIKAHFLATGNFPTSAQIKAALPQDADGNIAIDDGWDVAHPKAAAG
jgi:hypothetical protein